MALNEQETTQQDSKPVLTSKPLITDARHYKGILITEKDIKEMLQNWFTTYGIEDEVDRATDVIQCESGFQIYPKPNGISFGVAQFTKATWDDFGSGDIFNPQSQFQVMAKLWKKGEQGRWDCFTGKR